MEITLDITKVFDSVVDTGHFIDAGKMKPYIFFDFPFDVVDGVFDFSLMNFGLNMNLENKLIEEILKENSPNFDDIVDCEYDYKSIMIFGKAKFKITGVKGIDIRLWDSKIGEKLYYSNNAYKIKKGDFNFNCSGNSEFSSHSISLSIVANTQAQGTVTFDSNEYILMNECSKEFEEYVSSKQTAYDYKTSCKYDTGILEMFDIKIPKSFDFEHYQKYFKHIFSIETGFNTTMAVKNEAL